MQSNSVLIALLGDVALHGLFCEESEKNKNRFNDIRDILKKNDLIIANLETPIQGNGEINHLKKEAKGIIHFTQNSVVQEILSILNINIVSLANNHIYDCKTSGMVNTIQCLEKKNIKYTGAGNDPENIEPVIVNIKNQNIGLIAYVHQSTNPMFEEKDSTFFNLFDEEKIIDDIKKLKNKCQCIIVSLHWGLDYSFYPTKDQREISRRIIDSGADIIMGHHSHTVQPYEIYKDRYIFYSLGSFCFGDIIYEGKRRSLKRKTKKTILPILELNVEADPKLNLKYCYSLKELKGNTVRLKRVSLIPFLAYRRFLMKLKHKFKLVSVLINIKESIFDRIIEYFFGYYRNPFKQLIAFSNIRKLKYILRDLKKANNKSEKDIE